MEFTWDVQIPGEDLPRRLTLDYLLSEGEQVVIEGRPWLVERVDVEPRKGQAGVVTVAVPHEPF